MVKWLGHLRTISHHKLLVMRHCFQVGLYWQGLAHDLSKFSSAEFFVGVRYYQGNRSPNEAQRMEKGYSSAWLHHKGRNKHHLEYWLDYSPVGDHRITGIEMPVRYAVEMFCDRMAASKTYRGHAYQDGDPYEYYLHSKEHYLIHPSTRELLEKLLRMLRDKGETETFRYIRAHVLHQDVQAPDDAGRESVR